MSQVTLQYAICRWSDRTSAEYFPINNIHEYQEENGRTVKTVFDAYGRQLGDQNFNYPRPPSEEELLPDNDIKYYRFNIDNDHEIIIYKKIGYLNEQSGSGGGGGGSSVIVDLSLDSESTNAIANKAVTEALQGKAPNTVATLESPGLMSTSDKSKLDGLVDGYLGYYATQQALSTAHPVGQDGQFASIGSTDTIWSWDSDSSSWVNTDTNTVTISWNNVSGKPTFAGVAFSGSYDDLQNKPNLQLVGSSVSIASLTNGEILVTNDAIPVSIKTNSGKICQIEKGSLTSDSYGWHIDPTPYLVYSGAGSFVGPWTVYLAGGIPDPPMTITTTGVSISPLHNKVYKHTLAASDVISIDNSSLTSSQCVTFELWLDMPSTVVSPPTFPNITWIDGATPDFTTTSIRYAITVRWNGTKFLANLAYTEALA